MFQLFLAYMPPLSGVRDLEIILNRWMRLYYFVTGSRTALPLEYAFNSELKNIKFKDSGNKEVLVDKIIAFVNNDKALKNKILNKNNYKVLILEGDKNSNYVYNKLSENHIKSERLQIYETYVDKEHNLVTREIENEIKNNLNEIKYVVFFSPSGVDAVWDSLKNILNLEGQSNRNNKLEIIAIGNTTAKHIKDKYKAKLFGIADKPIPEALLELFNKNNNSNKS